MKNIRLSMVVAGLVTLQVTVGAQTFHRRAVIAGSGPAGRGQCVVEVIVDGAADLEIRGDDANLTNLSGRSPQWRRFECTSRIPSRPMDVRVTRQEGRGDVQVVQGMRNGVDAVVRISDREGGPSRYVFTIDWALSPGVGSGRYGDSDRYTGRVNDFSSEQALRVCEDAVRNQAEAQLRGRNIVFNAVNTQDNPGARDRIAGTFSVARGRSRGEVFQFDCAVNLNNGRVRSVRISRAPGGSYSSRYQGPAVNTVQSCESRVQERLSRQGYDYFDFGYVNPRDVDWPLDRVAGVARAYRGNQVSQFNFSCVVEARDGDVRSVNVSRRR